MKENTSVTVGEPVKDKRARNRLMLGAMGFGCGLLVTFTRKYLETFEGPQNIRITVALAPWVLVGVLAYLSRRLYQADELEILINRQALAFAFYAALFGLFLLHQLQVAGLAPVFAWQTKHLIIGLVLLMGAGILWSRRRYA